MSIQELTTAMNNREILSIEGARIAKTLGYNVFKRGASKNTGFGGKWCFAKSVQS